MGMGGADSGRATAGGCGSRRYLYLPRQNEKMLFRPHLFGKYLSEGDMIYAQNEMRAATKEDVKESLRYDGKIFCSGELNYHLNQKGKQRFKTELKDEFRKILNQCDITKIDGKKPFTRMEFENIKLGYGKKPSSHRAEMDFVLK